ncbi:MAG: 2-succinylbenzoate--CoA ligase [Chlamydiae bacterium]|nr:2-succinylbenzoate--CoA ligase [Chlamydiota bacterium]
MRSFECPFSLHGRESGESVALRSNRQTWSFAECHELIEGIARALKAEGVMRGERVALYPTKEFPTPLLFFALFRIGAIAIPLNVYLPHESISQSLDACGATFFLTPDGSSFPKVKQITLPFSKVVKSRVRAPQTFLDKEAHATYLFTSGTTSTPKIACHSLGNHYYSALGSNGRMVIKPGDHYLLSLPLYHVAGIAILFRTFLAGATLLLSEEIDDPRATHLSLIPTQLSRLLKTSNPGKNMQILLGGANLNIKLYNRAVQSALTVYPTYGMTEMSSQIATHYDPHSFSLGHPLPYREMKIAEDGEIYLRGKTLFQGYFDQVEGLSLPLNEEGWFCSRDLGEYSPKRGLQMIGRKDRLFISGGENIHPEEIERVLDSIEGVDRAEVLPIPDEEFGFRPVAYIESEEGYNEERVRAHLAKILPKFKLPVAYLPLTSRMRE